MSDEVAKEEANMKRRAENVIDRRGILKTSAAVLGGALLKDDSVEATAQNINTHSGPSRLKITDLRVAVVTSAPMTCPIIRIDTNQGVYGLGEVRDGASPSYALMLKSRLLGENPSTWIACSARSGSSAGRRGKREACALSKWPCGISPARFTTLLFTRC